MNEGSVFQAQTLYSWYDIDWDKVQTIDDLKLVLKSTNLRIGVNNPHFDEIQHLLKESE